jgi:hypothetical protein
METHRCNCEWRISDHFAICSNFEQSLLKMMTRRKRWSTSAGSGWPQGLSLVVQVSGGALARTSSVAPPIKIKSKFCGEIGSTQFLEQGSRPALFFRDALKFLAMLWKNISQIFLRG